MKNSMIVSSPEAKMQATLRCPIESIVLRGIVFIASLVVLKSSGLDVILGMDSLTQMRTVI
jgi:hypothetical protein